MNLNRSIPERMFCPSCDGPLADRGQTCPSCGAVVLIESALQDMKWKSGRRAEAIARSLSERSAYWVAWCLALVPFFVVPPLLACVLVLSGRGRKASSTTILTVAAVNIVLSLYFWAEAREYLFEVFADIAGWLGPIGALRGSGLLEV